MTSTARAGDEGIPVGELYRQACEAELTALKPGNVGLDSPGHGMTVEEFRSSARASAPALDEAGYSLGERIFRAVEATWEAVGKNTNLGIVLACAPLAQGVRAPFEGSLRQRVASVLAATTVEDAVWAYRAIRRSGPAGLGRSERLDVAAEPDGTLREAMAEARQRDRIAAAYCDELDEVFGHALPRMRTLMERFGGEPRALTGVYLGLLSRAPDSHILRKHGEETAREVTRKAGLLLEELESSPQPQGLDPRLRELDAELKAEGINPGTCADLTVATALSWRLEGALTQGGNQ